MQIQSYTSPFFSYLAQAMASTKPSADHTDLSHAGNWTQSAVYAVAIKDHDRQFPQVNHSLCVEFFDTLVELEEWKTESALWIRGTDYDFSREYSLYEWDLGPQCLGRFSI